jgi:hypothetical protein
MAIHTTNQPHEHIHNHKQVVYDQITYLLSRQGKIQPTTSGRLDLRLCVELRLLMHGVPSIVLCMALLNKVCVAAHERIGGGG